MKKKEDAIEIVEKILNNNEELSAVNIISELEKQGFFKFQSKNSFISTSKRGIIEMEAEKNGLTLQDYVKKYLNGEITD